MAEASPGAHRPGRPARLYDVARDAGVHVSTVSRVLRGTEGSIPDDTRQRIMASARKLRYRPNAMARGLRLSTAGAIGLLVPSLRNPVLAAIIRGAFARAWEREYVVLLAEDTPTSPGAVAYERMVGEGRIDGLLVASARPDGPPLPPVGDGVPLVYVNRRQPGSGRNVFMRDEDAGRLAAEHLLELGHRHLAHIAGEPGLDTADRRRHGFTSAVAAAGARATVVHAAFAERGGLDAMLELLRAAEPPTAVFASNINQAIGAFAGARVAGVRIPADVSLVGYDDDPVGEYLEAPLTAVAMPLDEMGRTAVDALIDQIEGRPPRDVLIESAPRLVIRESTAAPRAAR